MEDKKEEKPGTSAATAAGKVGKSPSKTWKFEGKLVSSKITHSFAESYNLVWETTIKQTPGEKYIRSKRYVIDVGNEYESHWRIELDPNFTDANGTRYLSAYLVLEKSFKPKAVISAFYHFTLNGCHIKFGGLSKFSAEKPSFGFPKFISFAELGKFAHPSNTEKLPFGITLQILKEDPNQFPIFPLDEPEQGQGVVDIEELDEAEDAILPFNPEEKPNWNAYLLFGNIYHPVDTTRVNYFTKFFEPYYVPAFTDLKNVTNAVDMKAIFGNEKKFEKLMEFCHTGNMEFPVKFEGLINILETAATLPIKQLKQKCGMEVLERLDITNFVQIVELVVSQMVDPLVANPVIWKFMMENIQALNQCTKFNETYQKHKSYYEALLVQDDPVLDDDDDPEDLSEIYS